MGKGAADDTVFAPPETAFRTSPLVTRPSRPVPETCAALRLFSAINLAAEGAAIAPFTAAGAGAEAGAAALGAAATVALPSLSIFAITCSATTVPPSATIISDSTPADGAGTSSTTLSVSISIKISS